ncbi:hypothetical protein F1737_05350 [Methanoplanus sp. FWC-SCC4]|uniref:Transglutaminase-like domain-containing protein n=1 Tax=Methanochimaera problematica TaxID=2609417 RepID=A0AA97FCU0_9EURY|nr:hypothetical protein [Methanoplanus sp. FWC-SCC4]WOF16172.1 hypothetical protein F1737_05350 [Methanoplanus sp. FWC-SCC4]
MSLKKGFWIIAVICFIAAFLTAGCINGIFADLSPEYPSIPVDSGPSEYISVTNSFLFQDSKITITIPVDKKVYLSAYSSDKYAYFYEEQLPGNSWSDEYYNSFVNDPQLNPLYTSVIGELRNIREEMNLDSDEYAELIFTYVQSIPYHTNEIRTEPKFPVEMVYENSGDCDDKAIFASGILFREGYDVVLFEFEEEEHMAVGIKSTDCGYMDTEYAFVEVTDVNYVSWPTEKLDGDKPLESVPYVIKVGNGTYGYESCDEVSYIYSALNKIEEKVSESESLIDSKKIKSESLYEEISLLDDKMSRLKAGGKINEYNALVSSYNEKIRVYNSTFDEIEKLIAQHNNYIKLYNYIIDHKYDRKGVFENIKNSGISN